MKRCGECGSSKLSIQNIKGSFHPWKDYSRVELLFDQNVLVCEACKNQIFTKRDLQLLDENIAQSILTKIVNAIEFLTSKFHLTQQEISIAMGCTPEYLSMLKSGKKCPRFAAFNLLMSYRKNPLLMQEFAGVKIVEPTAGFIGPDPVSYFLGINKTGDMRQGDSSSKRVRPVYKFQMVRDRDASYQLSDRLAENGRYPVYQPQSSAVVQFYRSEKK